MPHYKKIMIQRGVMQKAVAEKVHKTDPRVDTSLMSKFVNGVCLPTPPKQRFCPPNLRRL